MCVNVLYSLAQGITEVQKDQQKKTDHDERCPEKWPESNGQSRILHGGARRLRGHLDPRVCQKKILFVFRPPIVAFPQTVESIRSFADKSRAFILYLSFNP